MLPKINFDEVPNSFAICANAQCEAACLCLHHWAYAALPDSTAAALMINPKYARPTEGERCPAFQLTRPIKLARSFMQAIRQVRHGSVGVVAAILSERYSQRTYYRMRKGEYALTPPQQEEITALLEAHGAQAPVVFDSYEEAYNRS